MINVHIGTMPPPIGGISVYLYRLSKLRQEDVFINSQGMKKTALLRLLWQQERHFILHEFDVKVWFCVFLVSFFKNISYTIVLHSHALEFYYHRLYGMKKWIVKLILGRSLSIQVVNEKIKNFLIESVGLPEHKMIIQHAFLPPPLEEEEKIIGTYSKQMLEFLIRSRPLLVVNAFKLVIREGVDVYGVDMCLELVEILKKKYPDIGLIFALANDENEKYLEKLRETVKNLNLDEQVYFMTGQKELWPLFRKATVFLRPTTTDGDAVSVREALHFGCAVVASNVCMRPAGTRVFKSRNLKDFVEKVEEAVNSERVHFSQR